MSNQPFVPYPKKEFSQPEFIAKILNYNNLKIVALDAETYTIDPSQSNLNHKFIYFYHQGDEPFINTEFKSKAGKDIKTHKLLFKNLLPGGSPYASNISIPDFSILKACVAQDANQTQFIIFSSKNDLELANLNNLSQLNPGLVNLSQYLTHNSQFKFSLTKTNIKN